ncbi:serine protease (plasmid) [Nitratiruptor sp. YY08-26]|uniref:S8 family peptidase n=1 Tax=unclassified Nitratiruptor TaxID=2624044 RepID=UPI0018EA79FB|nr:MULTISPECIES: S8 family serine peptidase [unclassified Nitratiruptor]BCD63181.1 serine protease [Nitratiruptor sp. YY08-13]BCD67117.1 serine protease [Nitratiruptor sp. YY08-26]
MRFFLPFLLFLPLFGWEYYNHGSLQTLTSLPQHNRSLNIRYFKDKRGNIIGVTNRVIIKPKSRCTKRYTQKYSHKKLPDGSIVLFTHDPKETFEVANEIYESGCALFSHPDFLLFPKKRSFDPLFNPLEWTFHNYGQHGSMSDIDLDVYEAWQYASGKGVNVAVIDNGFDLTHPDLKGSFIAQTDLVQMDGDASYDNTYELHGTACAGLIAARKNGIGVQGIAYNSSLIGIKLIGSYPSGEDRPLYVSTILESFLFANEAGADVINCSWGTYDVADAVRYIIDKVAYEGRNGKGTPIVFASGNEGRGQWYWGDDESALESVIAVGAVTNFGQIAWYSNYGPALDFVAPSGGGTLAVTTTDIQGPLGYADGSFGHPNYCFSTDITGFNGTSAAAPQVSGVIALMLQRAPELTRDQVVEILKNTAKKVGDIPYEYGRNDYYGYGLVDADDAVKEAIKYHVRSQISGHTFGLAGYFIHIGPHPFDWVYISSNRNLVAKLAGIDEQRQLLWNPILLGAFDRIDIQDGEVIFGSSSDPFGQKLANRSYLISGYFTHYGPDAYDWVYVAASSHKSYKLEGLSYEKTFLWVDLDLLGEIEKNSIHFR